MPESQCMGQMQCVSEQTKLGRCIAPTTSCQDALPHPRLDESQFIYGIAVYIESITQGCQVVGVVVSSNEIVGKTVTHQM